MIFSDSRNNNKPFFPAVLTVNFAKQLYSVNEREGMLAVCMNYSLTGDQELIINITFVDHTAQSKMNYFSFMV